MTRTVLALDVSKTATGWAFGPPGGKPVCGVIRFAPKGASDDEVWLATMKWMTEQMKVMQPDVVAIEAPVVVVREDEDGNNRSSINTILTQWSLQVVLRTVVKALLPGKARLIHVQTARKFFIGRGNVPGEEAKRMVKQRCLQLGWVTPEEATYDKCDALCVWAAACNEIDRSVGSELSPLFSARAPAPASNPEIF